MANLFGKVFLAHQEKALPMFEHLHKYHIEECLKNPTEINIEYAIFLIVDAIDHLGKFLPRHILDGYFKILVEYMKYPNYEIN